MRIWSLHPKYLDTKGLVALWRETLLAKNVLEGNTKGYKNHPQLWRFKKMKYPKQAVNQYLVGVYEEAQKRGYHFKKEKIHWQFQPTKMQVNKGQIQYEKTHLLKKLKIRAPQKYEAFKNEKYPQPHPIFEVVNGEIENWEVL